MFVSYEGDETATLAAVRSLWFHTGDLGRFDADGHPCFVDRKKQSIRRRGENISSWVLERLVAKHPGVHECAVVGVPSRLGEDDVKLAVSPVEARRTRPNRAPPMVRRADGGLHGAALNRRPRRASSDANRQGTQANLRDIRRAPGMPTTRSRRPSG
jgi:acyl-CoA synthetase (AMP-forming)/AMP-acid ligase II